MNRRWWALSAVSLSVLAVSLDGTVLSVALPTLSGALHASESDLVWFSSGYLLVLAAAMLPAGLIGDRFGRKKVALLSLASFGVGSAICAYAGSVEMFLIGRLVQGAAGSGIAVMALSALIVLFETDERPKAVGIFQAANFIALPLGPILGGWMLAHFWWGWVFLINVPVVLIGLLAGAALIPESRSPVRPSLDPLGIAASTLGLVAVVYGLVSAGSDGWTTPRALLMLSVGALALAGFTWWERRLGARALLNPRLFASPAFTWGTLLSAVAGLAMIGALFTIPQYFQGVRGLDSFGAGTRMLPLIAGLVVGAGLAGRFPARPVVTSGFVGLAAALALGAFTEVGSATAFVAGWSALLGTGTGLALSGSTSAALAGLSADRSGTESAVVQAAQKAAGPLGTAITGSVLIAGYHAALPADGLPSAARQSLFAAASLGSPAVTAAARVAFVHGLRLALLVASGIALAGAVLALTRLNIRREGAPAMAGLRERKKAQTRASIQSHALRLFRENGYQATTIEQIITAAEVSETTFFRYFPTKEDLVLLDDYDPMLMETLQSQPASLTPIAAMRATFRDFFDGQNAEQRRDTQERIALATTVPAIRAAMLDQFIQAIHLMSENLADRYGRTRTDLAVRTIAGAVMGCTLVAMAGLAEDPSADLAELLDRSLAHLDAGLTL
jgi:EmrB/QacA subfamily drug resistance transporter